METEGLFINAINGDLLCKVILHELIEEDIESIGKTLEALEVKITSLIYSVQKTKDILNEEIDNLKETILIIRGSDNLPLYVSLQTVADIRLSNFPGYEKVTTILWKGGGSNNIDSEYFIPLKKYWIKNNKLTFIADLFKEPLIKELSLIEGFSDIYNEYVVVNARKIKMVKTQNFEKASEEREKEIELLSKLDKYVGEFMKSDSFESFKKTTLNEIFQQ